MLCPRPVININVGIDRLFRKLSTRLKIFKLCSIYRQTWLIRFLLLFKFAENFGTKPFERGQVILCKREWTAYLHD